MYASFNSGKGTVMSWMQFASQSTSDMNGQVIWLKSAGIAKNYSAGFTNAVSASGAIYRAPAPGNRVLGFMQGKVALTGGGLSQPLNGSFTLGLNNKATSTSANTLNLSIATSTGLFKGTMLNAATGKQIAIQGILSRKANAGIGYFFGNDNSSGQVYIGNAQ
jgi:hypothetical protein